MAVNLSRTFTTHPSPLDQRLRMQEHQQRMAAAAKVATKARAAEDPQATAAILADDPLPEECDCGGADARDVAQSAAHGHGVAHLISPNSELGAGAEGHPADRRIFGR